MIRYLWTGLIFLSFALNPARAEESYTITIESGRIERQDVPVRFALPVKKVDGNARIIPAFVKSKDGKQIFPVQIDSVGKKTEATFVLEAKLPAGAVWKGTPVFEAVGKSQVPDVFSIQTKVGEYEDLSFGDHKIWRYMMAYDPAKLEETYKVFHHIHDFHGNGFITKGAGGKYTHHRGLFAGWRKTTFEGKEYDTWHMKPDGTIQKHAGFDDGASAAGPVVARRTHLVDWLTPEGNPIFNERRTLTAWRQSAGRVLIDVLICLESKNDVKLDGDPPHAGFQFRAAQEVADNENLTNYVLPAGVTRDKDDNFHGDWAAASFPIQGHNYSVLYMPHKSNRGRDTAVTNARNYARFGEFFPAEVKAGEPFEMRYRILVVDTDTEGPITFERCQSAFDDYNSPVKVEVGPE